MEKLPDEILIDILSRLPIKPLGLCSCVSRKWYITITSFEFLNTYIKQQEALVSHNNNNNPDFIICYKVSPFRSGNKLHFVENKIVKPSKIDLPFIQPSSNYLHLIVMGSCNGLLCLSTLDLPEETYHCCIPTNPIYILNPITREYMILPPFIYPACMSPNGVKMKAFMSGFGFDVAKQEYKFVLVLFYKYAYWSEYTENEVQVYTLGSKSWNRIVGVVPHVLLNAYLTLSWVFIDGCIHWITVEDLCSPNGRPEVVSFYLGVEEFSVFSTPTLVVSKGEADREGSNNKPLEFIKLGVLEEHLSLTDSSTDFIRIWQMKNDNGNKSWIQLFVMQKDFSLNWHIGPIHPIKLRKNGELVVHNSWDIVSYNTITRNCDYLMVNGISAEFTRGFEVVPFVGTLVSIKSACRTGMKNKSEISPYRSAKLMDHHRKFTCCLL